MSIDVTVNSTTPPSAGAATLLVVDHIVGNVADERWAAKLAQWEKDGRVERLRVDTWEAQKSRLRKRTDQGTELGVTLPRGKMLRHGDVLVADEAEKQLIVVEVEGRHVLVLELEPQADAVAMTQLALKVGHMLGNQHWPVKVDGLTVYVPVVVSEKVMQSVLKTHNVPGVRWHIEEADPAMDLPLVAPDLADHVHAHPHQHGVGDGQDHSGSGHDHSGHNHRQGHDHGHSGHNHHRQGHDHDHSKGNGVIDGLSASGGR